LKKRVADRKHGFQAVTSNRNDSDLSACRWLRARAVYRPAHAGSAISR